MEAPEKLYVDVTDNPNDVWLRAFRQPFKKCGIEYIRTDAFIKKACEWLERNFNMPDDFEKHFRKAMEEYECE